MKIDPKEHGHIELGYDMSLPQRAKEVFPLLCPVREYDWIGFWECEMKHSVSGVAEEGCVFTTDLPDMGPATWVCTRYEPPLAIDYAVFFEAGHLRRLKIRLQDNAAGCMAYWRDTMTAVTPQGKRLVDAMTDSEYQQFMGYIEQLLVHYLKTGTMLDAPPPTRSEG